MPTRRHTAPNVASATDTQAESDQRPSVPPPFVYALDDLDIEVAMHRNRNAPESLVRALTIVFKQGTLAGLTLHGFTVWTSRRQEGYEVRYPSRDWLTPAEGFRRPWALLRSRDKNDFAPLRRLDRLILEAAQAAPPVSVTIG